MRKFFILAVLTISICLIAIPVEEMEKVENFRVNNQYELELDELQKLSSEYPDDFELYWRMARANFDLADQSEEEETQKKFFYSGFEAAKIALKLNPESAKANHWYAVLIGKIGMIEGTKQKIKNSYKVREYALKAIELDPTNDGTMHLMGRWHYELASLSWFERKIASLIYAKPPEASLDIAITYFKSAIDTKSDEVRHYLWLGKTHMEMKENTKAENAFRKATMMDPLDQGDKILQKEAKKLLKKVK